MSNYSRIKIIGIGDGGVYAVTNMFGKNIAGVDFAICNTDYVSLSKSKVPHKLHIKKDEALKKGKLQASQVDEIKSFFSTETEMLIIIACLGGMTATSLVPIFAKIAQELNILTLTIVTLPFKNEGQRRMRHAMTGVIQLEKYVDSLVIMENEKIIEICGDLTTNEAFSLVDDYLLLTARAIPDIINVQGYINVDFPDIETAMRMSGSALIGIGTADGENRALDAVKKALYSSLLKNSDFSGARDIILNITSGEEITLNELSEITDSIQSLAGYDSDLIWGNGIDKSLGNKLRITIIATGFPNYYLTRDLYYLEAEELLEEQNRDDDDLSLFFIDNEYTPTEIAEIISCLSEIYKEIGGDELIIRGTDIYEKATVLEPKLI